MTLTVADIDRWSGDAVRVVFDTCSMRRTASSTCMAELENGLRSKPSFEAARIDYSNWPGKPGTVSTEFSG